MSVLEELEALERRIVSRLTELRPLVEEYEQLQQVAARYGFDVKREDQRTARRRTAAKKPPRKPGKAAARRSSSRRASGGTKAVGAARRARILELVEERPGISVPDLSRELGVDPPPLYRTVRKLQADGVIKKEGMSLTLA